MNIGILLFDNVEELDWVGPWEVLASWAGMYPEDGVHVFTVGYFGVDVRCANGARVIADHALQDAPDIDVLIVPGGHGVSAFEGNDAAFAWLNTLRDRGSIITSVCTGAIVLARAGLLDGRPATTWWGAIDLLRTLGQDIDVRPDDRYVDSGEIITAAGVSAGIDMALHLIVRFHSAQRAAEVKRYIQYEPAPPV